MKHTFLFLLIVLPGILFCQKESKKGTIITEYGKTYEVKNPDFKTDLDTDLKAVFDVGRSFGDSTKLNPLINTAARYLNMHASVGVSEKNLKVALVIHGSAANDILNNEKYKSKFGINNPNTSLISALTEKGVQIILCGQTAAHRNISKSDTHPNIKFALSAMTALVQLQNKNYRLINF
ncbi:Intracellular sulfur oxidation protein, DsrE/DsrF family [Aquimarina amphilecti]|uniref:Intracellular sulfur oxidation protein, DsrE/DsrF family n=1 Tax=Aquimarina amphilecti TaxID=1038014 RepID=A0A1H7X8D8_AQUAM|nr:DsrE family protein [Aquimarina amphilecti]SEM29398.1 Intracellular sulfur oxidation protein, DsrE/DsrF family [Aquimarina amphilecti]